jgi:hypothetical protein
MRPGKRKQQTLIVQTAHTRRRWGYRMIHDVLRPQYPDINHKQWDGRSHLRQR